MAGTKAKKPAATTKIATKPKLSVDVVVSENSGSKKASRESLLAKLNTAMKSKVFRTYADDDDIQIERLSSGILSLDLILGQGKDGKYGWPVGRISEIYGPTSTGKTSIVVSTIASAQKEGLRVLLVDAEHCFDLSYAKKLGVDIEELFVIEPDHGEQGYEAALVCAASNDVDLIVIDSVEGMVPKSMLEGTMEDQFMGTQSKMNNRFLRQISTFIQKKKCTVLLINQLRQKIGVMYGSNEVIPGGQGIAFWSGIMLEVRRQEDVGKYGDDKVKDGIKIGHFIKAFTKKNKTSVPQKTAKFMIEWGVGFSKPYCLISQALDMGIIVQGGAWFTFPSSDVFGEKKWQGRANIMEEMETNQELASELEATVLNHE